MHDESQVFNWHATSRGIRKTDIIVDRADPLLYLRQAGRLAREHGVRILAFGLEDNHVHWLLRADRKSLGRFYMNLHTIYVRDFNRRHGLSGRMFDRNFKPFLIRDTRHLIMAAVYIAINPVKDLGYLRPEDYPHSSYRYVVNPRGKPEWLDTGLLLKELSPDPAEGARIFRRLVEVRTALVARRRSLYATPPQAEDDGRSYRVLEYSDGELKMILDTLLDPAVRGELARAARLPGEAFSLYAAKSLQLASTRRLACLLGIGRNLVGKWIGEIDGDEYIKRRLGDIQMMVG